MRSSPMSSLRRDRATERLPGTVFLVERSPFFEPHFNVGAVAQLAQPFLIGLVTLSIENSFPRLDALAFGGHVRGTPLEHLNKMPSERSLDGLAYIHRFQLRKTPLEFRHGIARIDPAKVSTPRSRAVVRIQAGELGEVHAVYDAFPQAEQLPLCFVLGNEIVGARPNITHVRLLHEDRRTGAAQLEELEHVASGGASKHAGEFSVLQTL